ncbi:hypothetical protein AGDE_07488 [Angomonas deanei]|nr:hypothetical protein AGDE_07488 [Angomonas deanei]|eukprot:EPY35296.1 hypothetical protein AGDE_07488 [Angomonas deanei]
MAHLIAPVSEATPMTKEEAQRVQQEKKKDNETHQLLAEHYQTGDGGKKKIFLTRRNNNNNNKNQNYICPKCKKQSNDIRNVCAFCVTPLQENKKNENNNKIINSENTINKDKSVQLLHTNTGRCYRLFTEPITTGKNKNENNPIKNENYISNHDDDEPDCEEGEAYNLQEGETEHNENENNNNNNKEKIRPYSDKIESPYTHFISIPVGKYLTVQYAAGNLLNELREFISTLNQENNENESNHHNLTIDLVQKSASRLHITLLLLKLENKEEIHFAKELFTVYFAQRWKSLMHENNNHNNNNNDEKIKETLLSNNKYIIQTHSTMNLPHLCLRGLHVMPSRELQQKYKNEMSKHNHYNLENCLTESEKEHMVEHASVVYMGFPENNNHNDENILQQLQNELRNCFQELLSKNMETENKNNNNDEMNLFHMTLLNKKWTKQKRSARPFNAKPILENFETISLLKNENNNNNNQFFAIPYLELCSMNRADNDNSEYYVEASVGL